MKSSHEKYTDAAYQREVGELVRREVKACASTLISNIMEHAESWPDWCEDLYSVCSRENYLDALTEAVNGGDVAESDIVEALLDTRLYNEEDVQVYTLEERREAINDHITSTMDPDDMRELAEQWNIEPYIEEAYEHCIVSPWLAEQLKERGEIVADIFDLNVWGRTITGQAILLDGVICDIYDDVYGDQWRLQQMGEGI